MPITDTPLRYPGGKSQLTPLVIDVLQANNLFYGEYAEPFAGGSGIAMTLLLNNYVSQVYLNDIDPAIYAFWYSVVNDSEALCALVEHAVVSIDEWRKQREIFLDDCCNDLLKKGFATLFLNRTNRSGILRGGVIGGASQEGKYKIDCRFNKVDLVRKIKRIADYRDHIKISRLNAVDFLSEVVPTTAENTLVNLDPPYFGKGPELYTNFYNSEDHGDLARAVAKLKRLWMVTYDDAPEIRSLYKKFPLYSSSLNYYAQDKRVGVELLALDPRLRAPASLGKSKIESFDSVAACV